MVVIKHIHFALLTLKYYATNIDGLTTLKGDDGVINYFHIVLTVFQKNVESHAMRFHHQT